VSLPTVRSAASDRHSPSGDVCRALGFLRARTLLHSTGENNGTDSLEPVVQRDLVSWSNEIRYTTEILNAAIKRGELRASRPSGFQRGRLYISSDAMQRWLGSIQFTAEDGES
jgi:hypothetical protein